MDVLYEVFQINIIIIYNDSANEIHLVPVFLLYNTWYFYQQSTGAYQCRKTFPFIRSLKQYLSPDQSIQQVIFKAMFEFKSSLSIRKTDMINSFLGPYCKLWNTIFPLEFMAYTLHALAINLSRKNLVCNLQHRPGTQLVRVCNYL